MVRIEGALAREGFRARMLLQIHDELIFEADRDRLHEIGALVRSEMERVIDLSVPLAVTLKTGQNWYDVEETHDF
jgi:DNA polymerase-1